MTYSSDDFMRACEDNVTKLIAEGLMEDLVTMFNEAGQKERLMSLTSEVGIKEALAILLSEMDDDSAYDGCVGFKDGEIDRLVAGSSLPSMDAANLKDRLEELQVKATGEPEGASAKLIKEIRACDKTVERFRNLLMEISSA